MDDSNSSRDDNDHKISRNQFALLVHDHINKYIKLADNKASILLSGLVAYLGISLSVIGSNWFKMGVPFKFWSFFTVSTAMIAVYYAASAVYPNTPETPQGLILWDSIVKRSQERYRDVMMNKPEEKLLEELIDENYKLAQVSVGKYVQVQNALVWTGLTVACALVTLLWFII